MDIEKLIERFKNFDGIKPERELDLAIEALSTLQAENESLKGKLYDGEGVNLVDYWMQQAKIEENGHRNCQAENEKLRDEMKQERAHRLHAEQHADAFLEDCKRLNAELEQVKWENNALWTYIEIVDREYRRYMDRGYIDRLDELKRTWKCGQKED